MAVWTGWLAVVAIFVAGLVPLVVRIRTGKRSPPSGAPTRLHVILGLVTSALAFGHTLVVLPALGSPAATAAGMLALAPGALAFLVLVAHAGLGLQLRDEKLKGRAKTRRTHLVTAIFIVVVVTVHVVAFERAVP